MGKERDRETEVVVKERFADRLKDLMNDNGINQKDLALCMGVDKAAVSQWCSGTYLPDLIRGVKLCQHFGCSMDYLFLGSCKEYSDQVREMFNRIEEMSEIISDKETVICDLTFELEESKKNKGDINLEQAVNHVKYCGGTVIF